MLNTEEGGVESGGFGRSMLGRVRTEHNHSLCEQSRNEELLISAAIPAGFSSLPELSTGYLLLDGEPGEAAELLMNLRPRTAQFHTICTNVVSSFRVLVFSG